MKYLFQHLRMHIDIAEWIYFYRAMLRSNSAVMPQYVVCLSLCLSVSLTDCDIHYTEIT